jgi:hypothetical protein
MDKITKAITRSKLTWYTSQNSVPPEESDDEHSEVEKILDHRRSGHRKQMEYLVKWKDHPTSENSWVKESHFDTIGIINKFWASLSNVKRKFSNSILLKPLNMFLVSLFFILFCCTTTSAQILISENLPFCDMTKTPNLIDMHRSCHHSR